MKSISHRNTKLRIDANTNQNNILVANTLKSIDNINVCDVIFNKQRNNSLKLWKVWGYFLSSYNSVSFLALTDDRKNDRPRKIKYKHLLYYGLLFTLSKDAFVLWSIGVSLLFIALILLSLSRKTDRVSNLLLDYIFSEKSLFAIGLLSLVIFLSLIISASYKLYLQRLLNSKEIAMQFSISNNSDDNSKSKLKFVLKEAGQDFDGNISHKIKFNCKNFDSKSNFINSNKQIALHKSSFFSYSGHYRFFYFISTVISLNIGIFCITAAIYQNSEKVSFLKEFFQQHKAIGFSIAGIVVSTILIFLLKKSVESIYDLIKCRSGEISEGIGRFIPHSFRNPFSVERSNRIIG